MADRFTQLLRSELDAVEAELVRLGERRRLVEELLNLGSASPATPASSGRPQTRRGSGRSPASPASSTSAASARPPRRPRGLISAKIREFLGSQREPAHATAILAYLQRHDAAPGSDKPMPTLQSNLQRMKETGELENTGRNHWRLRSSMVSATSAASPTAPTSAAPAASDAPAAPVVPSVPTVPSAVPPVVTSTTRFGSGLGGGQ